MNICDTNPLDDDTPKAVLNNIVIICAPFTVLFNTVVLVIAFKYVNLSERCDQWFVVYMSAVNLLFGLTYMMASPYSAHLPGWLCRPYYVIIWSCTALSVLFLLLLNVHKFITLFLPYQSQKLISKRNVLLQIAIVSLMTIIYSVVSASQLTFITTDPCYQCRVKPEPYFYAGMMIIFYLCPLMLSLIISICIFVLAQSKTRNPSGMEMTSEERKTVKRIFFVFSYTVFTACTLLPFRIAFSYDTVCTLYREKKVLEKFAKNIMDPFNAITEYNEHTRCVDGEILHFLLCILPFGAVINPLITIVTQKFYRVGVQKIFSNFTNCLSNVTCRNSSLLKVGQPLPARL